MAYVHFPELGIPSTMRKGLGVSVSHERLFQQYETELLPKQEEAKTVLYDLIAEYPRVALVCFEADHHYCHRHTLIEHLHKAYGLTKPVKHI